jgi:hypothetical protein
MQLKDGELEKTKNWAQEVAKTVLKNIDSQCLDLSSDLRISRKEGFKTEIIR